MEKILAPIPGKITAIAVKEGQAVKAGQLIVTLEAMKMQNEIFCGDAGTVKEILVKEGDKIAANQVMVSIE